MIDAIVRKVKDLLTNPLETFRKSREDEMTPVVRYFLALLVVDAVLTAIISLAGFGIWGMVGRVTHIHHPILIFLLVLIGGLILAPIFAAWLHLWVWIVGGRKGFSQTLKAVMYGATPRFAPWLDPHYRYPVPPLGNGPCHLRDPRTARD